MFYFREDTASLDFSIFSMYAKLAAVGLASCYESGVDLLNLTLGKKANNLDVIPVEECQHLITFPECIRAVAHSEHSESE